MKHWKMGNRQGDYVYIYSPTLHLNDKAVFKDFKERMLIRREFDLLEKDILDSGLKGWISDTETCNPHIIRIFAKNGAKPYFVKTEKDPTKDTIWFMKTLEE